MNLLSANDFDALKKAMLRGEEICLERGLGDFSVTAKTCPVAYPWPVSMVVQIQVKKGDYSWSQNFETIEAAREGLKKGCGLVYQIHKILGGDSAEPRNRAPK